MATPTTGAAPSSPSRGLFEGLNVVDSPVRGQTKDPPIDKVTKAVSADESTAANDESLSVPDIRQTPTMTAPASSESEVVVVVENAPVTERLLEMLGEPSTPPSAAREDTVEAVTALTETKKQEAAVLEEAFRETSPGKEKPGKPVVTVATPPSIIASDASLEESTVPVSVAVSPRPPQRCQVHVDTPIPNSDIALRLLRTKFAWKTRSKIVTTYGGTKARTLLSYLFGNSKEDPTFVTYRDLMDILFTPEQLEQQAQHQQNHDSAFFSDISTTTTATSASTSSLDAIVDSVLGESGDSMVTARDAMATFCYLLNLWGHASARLLDTSSSKQKDVFAQLLPAAWDTAAQLVAHGCLDGVLIGMSSADEDSYQPAVHMLAQSVFAADLSHHEKNELSAIQFLLTAGCRQLPNDSTAAMLRGSHLLQTIRILYHIYLTTESTSNKTTARAALQQLVASVFLRVIHTDAKGPPFTRTADHFPSENHRDAFLVLRAICKLSMRSLPDPNNTRIYTGLQTSGSNETWDGANHHHSNQTNPTTTSSNNPSSHGDGGTTSAVASGHPPATPDADVEYTRERAQLVYTAAIHPALESKLLALELLNYILQNVTFSPTFIHRSGPQFQAAVRNYLCVSLLKNCTSDNTRVVNLSLRIFVPLMRNFRTILKNEIEAFVTNVFFVILDSKHSTAEHKGIVVRTFDEICSNPTNLAEIFLNYDCDMSAVDLFHRIVNTLSKISRAGLLASDSNRVSGGATSSLAFVVGGVSAARMERYRNESRELRLDAMKALRQVLASLHASIVEPMNHNKSSTLSLASDEIVSSNSKEVVAPDSPYSSNGALSPASKASSSAEPESPSKSLVEIYGSKKKRRAEESEVVLRFNQKPSAGISFAASCGHIDAEDPRDVAGYLLKNKDVFDKTQIGELLGREAEYQHGFSLKVLHEYVRLMDFAGLSFDDAIRYFLSGFRLPGEAQKIDRIMEKFAERFTEQNPDVFPTADVAFILAFSIIMLNTDLHNPAIKEDRRMTREGFIRNNRGICDGQDLPEELLNAIFDRIKSNPISLKEDEEARERVGDNKGGSTSLPAGLSPASFFTSHYEEMDRARETSFQKERDHIVRTTESLLKRRRSDFHGKTPSKARQGKPAKHHASKFVRTEDSGLRDEYVSPMFEVAWGPALAAFSTAMESANGTMGALIAIASDEELEMAAENAAETIEVCLTGFRFAICTAGLCGNDTARDAYVLALSRFSQLGTGTLLEPRHIRCTQTLMSIARDDGELLGRSWEHVFRALSEINRFHQIFQLMARNDRAVANAAERRKSHLAAKEKKRKEREARRAEAQDGESLGDDPETTSEMETDDDSLDGSSLFSEDEEFPFEEDMDAKAIDEANARAVYDGVSESTIEAIYQRSATLSAQAIEGFVTHLCIVSRMEISARGDDLRDLNRVSYRQQHALLGSSREPFHHTQPNIYNLQKLVEVTHYNMESRPRLIFADLWTIVANHLTGTALHSNPAIAMYAVDSFRQLSIQYLQRDELEVFEFQKRFLKPLEVVMAKSAQTSTKELLLNCVDRIVHVFRVDEGPELATGKRKGGLKSGWVPILTILGLGGRDYNEAIAEMSFKILTGEIQPCLGRTDSSYVLLSDHFVETVNALLSFVSGQFDDLAKNAIDQLRTLAKYLADEAIEPPHLKRRPSSITMPSDIHAKEELGLWWPILLGLSRGVGDPRMAIRTKCLDTLMGIIKVNFFPPAEESTHAKRNGLNSDIQVLQLIFRGVLFPVLEHAELEGLTPQLPEDFDRCLSSSATLKKMFDESESLDEDMYAGWLDTMFDPFIDSCIALCRQSIAVFEDVGLVEEVFALLNICLLSDSGALAVRGLYRLEQFITSDLDPKLVTDDVWATASHMLRRCLLVRDLPIRTRPSVNGVAEGQIADAKSAEDDEYAASVREFLVEEAHFPERRYIGSNVTNVIGQLLSSDRFSIALRWRLFLIAGLGRGIVDWEQAGSILAANQHADNVLPTPPSYYETALYGRKWMNRFLLQLASMKEIAVAPAEGDPKSNRFVAGQKLVTDETQRLLTALIKQEQKVAAHIAVKGDEVIHARLNILVTELLAGYLKMDQAHLKDMSWINPILLESCIQSKNEEIRLSVQKLVKLSTAVVTPSQPPSADTKQGSPPETANSTTEASLADGKSAIESPSIQAKTGDKDSSTTNSSTVALVD